MPQKRIFPHRRCLGRIAVLLACLLLALLVVLLRMFPLWHWHPPVSAAEKWQPQIWQADGGGSQAELKLVTWNVFGLPALTEKRSERIRAIADKVAASGADIACFQEVFMEADRRVLCERLAEAGLTYWRYFSSLPGGSGLLSVSRFPIEEAVFMRFSEGGDPWAFEHGDWWAGKGAGVLTLRIPDFGALRVINTHLHAGYMSDHYDSVRQSQMAELMDFVAAAGRGGFPVLLLGDLNYVRRDPYWSKTRERHHLTFAAAEWSALDYVLVADQSNFTFTATQGQPLEGTLADGQTPLSDHTGILAQVSIRFEPPAQSVGRAQGDK